MRQSASAMAPGCAAAVFAALVVVSGQVQAQGKGEGPAQGDAKGGAQTLTTLRAGSGAPSYLQPFADEQSKSKVVRITGSGGAAIRAGRGKWSETAARQQYSKVGAWSCDQALMFLVNRESSPSVVFLDGARFEPVDIDVPPGLREMRWHPRQPDTMIATVDRAVVLWNVRTGKQERLRSFSSADLGFGPWEGNPSDDGDWIVVTAGEKPVTSIVPFNLRERKALAPITHGFKDVDFATISPTGRYVLVNGVLDGGRDGDKPDRTRVFDRSGKAVGETWAEFGRPSHFDLTVDDSGDDIAVGVSKTKPDEGSVISRRLKDGQITRLTTSGFAGHTSARNLGARGRVVVSFAPDADSWGPYSDQVLSVSTSRKDDVRVVARMHARVDDYWSEPQPGVSPDGLRVVFASNWKGRGVAAYVADVPGPVAPGPHSIGSCREEKR